MNAEQKETYERYRSLGFDDGQLTEIAKGLENGTDPSFYARKNIPADSMAYIRKKIEYERKNGNSRAVAEDTGEGCESPGDDAERLSEAVSESAYEKLFVFALTVSGLSILAGIYSMLISWPAVW